VDASNPLPRMTIAEDACIDRFMEEVITELERMAYPLISAGVTGVDVEELTLKALNIVRERYGYPPTTERPNLGRRMPA
jgi:O-acetyl-ADP-ribose deacetylase (regulator of RNase III)